VPCLHTNDPLTRISIHTLSVDRRAFIEKLNEVRRIRNDIMHFSPDGVADEDLTTLRRFSQFLQRLRELERQAGAECEGDAECE